MDHGFDEWDLTEIEKTHLLCCKHDPGVNRSVPNIMPRTEMRRFPLLVSIEKRTISFVNHIKNSKNSSVNIRS